MYGEPPQCMTKSAVTARKNHNCDECHAGIEEGEVYEKVTGVWAGKGQTFKTCWPCAEVRNQLTEDNELLHDEGICFGTLQEELGEFCREVERAKG